MRFTSPRRSSRCRPSPRSTWRCGRGRGAAGSGPACRPLSYLSLQARTYTDQFVVLASSGIWDVMANEDVAAFLLEKTREGEEEKEEDEATERGSD